MSSPTLPAASALPVSPAAAPAAPVLLEEHDDEGRLLARTSLLNGELHGRMQRFGADGALQMQADYRHGQLDGLLTVFDEQGALVMSAEYRDGLQHGLQRLYVAGGGSAGGSAGGGAGAAAAAGRSSGASPPRCLAEHRYRHGLLHGTSLSYDEAGDVSARLPYAAGHLEGTAVFYRHGQKVREAAYRAGLLEGASTDFDSTGSVVQVLHHRANLLHGPTQRLWPDGTLMEEQAYHAGRPVGPPQRYDAKGRPMDAEDAAPGVLARLERLIRG